MVNDEHVKYQFKDRNITIITQVGLLSEMHVLHSFEAFLRNKEHESDTFPTRTRVFYLVCSNEKSKTMRIRLLTVLFMLTGFSVRPVHAQNIDLTEGKEFSELAQTNPAFAGVLEQFRFLFTQSNELKAGLESKLLKNNYLSFHFNQDELDHLRRQNFTLSYAREKKFENGIRFKYAGNATYNNKTFFREQGQNGPFSFTDFNGFTYDFTESRADSFNSIEQVDVGLGFGLLYKNLIAGLNINHLNAPDVSVLKGVENRLPLEVNAQLGGFINLNTDFSLFPNALFSLQGNEYWLSGGLGLNYKTVILNGQYELYNDFQRLDIGLTARIDRFLVGIGYTNYIASSSNQDNSAVRLTLNGSIFKPKKSLEGVLSKLTSLY
jgi:hypothetical protein